MRTTDYKRIPGYTTLLVATILMTLAAVLTLLPWPRAYTESLAEYRSHCTFAPLSTVLSLVAAGLLCMIRRRLFTTRPRRPRRPRRRVARRRVVRGVRRVSSDPELE